MSELQRLLNDPNRPGESTISILLNSGDAAYTFQEGIFRYLNIRDARHLRRANRRLDEIVRGEVRDILKYITPNVAAVTYQNSTLRLLGGRCYGKRLPADIGCYIGPLDSVYIASCTGIPPRLDPNGAQPCRGDICRRCVRSAARYFLPDEQHRIQKGHEVPLCRKCHLYEIRRNPEGFSSCICRGLMDCGHRCHACRYSTLIQLLESDQKANNLLRQTHKDRQGNRYIRNTTRQRLPCPGCGSAVHDPDGAAAAVVYCMSCKGIEVKATSGTSFQASRAVPVVPTRRSSRIKAINAAKPALDFIPNILSDRQPQKSERMVR